ESLALRGIAVVPNPTLYVNATQAQVAQGKLAEAARTVESFVARAPQSPLTSFLRSSLAEARRDFDSAEVIVQEQAQLAPDRPYLALAWLYAEAGRPERGRQLLAEYEATVPDAFRRREPVRHGAAAAVALAEGRVQDAISAYRAWYDQDNCAVCGLFDLARA